MAQEKNKANGSDISSPSLSINYMVLMDEHRDHVDFNMNLRRAIHYELLWINHWDHVANVNLGKSIHYELTTG